MNQDYAIVETGGKQYRVKPGDAITVERLDGDEGDSVDLERVLLVCKDGDVVVGAPTVEGARVVAEIAGQGKADKVIVFKYKPKTRHHVKNGHRQLVTKLRVREIVAGAASAVKAGG